MRLNSPWYELVRDGKKIYEGRCKLKSLEKYKIGDIIEISHHNDNNLPNYKVVIKDILFFPTFENALLTLPIHDILPLEDITVEKGVEIYKKFIPLSTQIQNGVAMIKIERV